MKNIIFKSCFLLCCIISILIAGKKYPDWFLFPHRFPEIIVGYNYNKIQTRKDAATNYCVFNKSIVRGDLYRFSNTEKKYSGYFYYYDKKEYNIIQDSLLFLENFVINTLPLNVITAYSLDNIKLKSKKIDIEKLHIPGWINKTAYFEGSYYYGIGVYTASGNDIDAWKTAEEKSIFNILLYYSTVVLSIKHLYQDDYVDYYEHIQNVHCEYSLKRVEIIERFHDLEKDLVYVLTRIHINDIYSPLKH